MERLCKIRDLQHAVARFEAAFERRYGLCLNEGMTLCTLSRSGRLCPGELGERLGDRGIALRAGLHCAPLAHQTVGTLETGTVRASVSAFNTEGEIQQVAWVLRRLLG